MMMMIKICGKLSKDTNEQLRISILLEKKKETQRKSHGWNEPTADSRQPLPPLRSPRRLCRKTKNSKECQINYENWQAFTLRFFKIQVPFFFCRKYFFFYFIFNIKGRSYCFGIKCRVTYGQRTLQNVV